MEKSIDRNRLSAGIGLIVIGLLVLAAQFIRSDWVGLLFLPALGLIFLVWGSATRNVGLLIPGGILSGLGLGVFLIEVVHPNLESVDTGGIFLASFGLGWGLITLFSAIFTDRTHWWPLIPGSILGLIGGLLLTGDVGLEVLEFAGKLWPVALIGLGLWFLLRRGSRESPQ